MSDQEFDIHTKNIMATDTKMNGSKHSAELIWCQIKVKNQT